MYFYHKITFTEHSQDIYNNIIRDHKLDISTQREHLDLTSRKRFDCFVVTLLIIRFNDY